jgi:hypothetical protein
MNQWINLSALWKIIVIGLLAGAGLPALFAIGLRALNSGPQAPATAGVDADGNDISSAPIVTGGVPGIAAATLCFAAVLAAIGWGIYSIVSHS